MSTGYGWEGIRQVCATLLGARHVPERLQRGAIQVFDLLFDLYTTVLLPQGRYRHM